MSGTGLRGRLEKQTGCGIGALRCRAPQGLTPLKPPKDELEGLHSGQLDMEEWRLSQGPALVSPSRGTPADLPHPRRGAGPLGSVARGLQRHDSGSSVESFSSTTGSLYVSIISYHSGRPSSRGQTPDILSPSATATEAIQLRHLRKVGTLGRGQSVVYKVKHEITGQVFALKKVSLEVTLNNEKARQGVLTELRTLYESVSDHLVQFHGAFYSRGAILICLEFMEGGSLHDVYRAATKISEPILAVISKEVLEGLHFLHKRHPPRNEVIIHRDIKPGNILVGSHGSVKLADFGVSGTVANTIASAVSWVGTVSYMSPERIQGQGYNSNCDIWSLGLTLMECAIGSYPYPALDPTAGKKLEFWDLLSYIVKEPPPLPSPEEGFSEEFCSFISRMLVKDKEERASAEELLAHPFLERAHGVDLEAWLAKHPRPTYSVAEGEGRIQKSPQLPEEVVGNCRRK